MIKLLILISQKLKKYGLFMGSCMLLPLGAAASDYGIKVCKLQALSTSNNASIAPCDGWESKNNCSSGSWIRFDVSQFQGQAMYSAALAAQMSGKTITVRLDGSTCSGGYDVTTMVRVNN